MKFGHIHEEWLIYAKLSVVIANREYFTKDAALSCYCGERKNGRRDGRDQICRCGGTDL